MHTAQSLKFGLILILRYVSLGYLVTVALFGQDPYGRITGRVVDSAGAIVPGASIRANNIESNLVTNATSDSQGNFEARDLIPGQYELVVEMKGFRRYQRGPIEVRLGDVSSAIRKLRRIASQSQLPDTRPSVRSCP